jgi:nucleotide-binding universal stress UspA family protein
MMTKVWMRPAKILASIDLTPASDLALERAIALAADCGALLYVLHAVDDDSLPSAKEASERAKTAEAEIERRMKANPAAAAVAFEVFTSLGNPVERILSACDRLYIDLVVMGTGEKRTLGQRLLGSTVERILRRALQPVLTVRNPTDGPYQKLAVATDFSQPSRVALECALGLFPNAQTTVVHAYEAALHGLLSSDRVAGTLAERHEREMAEYVRCALAEFVAKAHTPALALSVESATGTPESVLTRLVKKAGVDLVVVGTHGRTGVRRALLGSVAERLIEVLPTDVLAVPTPE